MDLIQYYNVAKDSYRQKRSYFLDNTPKMKYGDIYAFGHLFSRVMMDGLKATANIPPTDPRYQKALVASATIAAKANSALQQPIWMTAPVETSRSFWSAVSRAAIEVGSIEVIPSSWELAKESLTETLEDRWGDVKDVVNLVPKVFDWVATLVKWGAIGIVGYFGIKVYEDHFSKRK